ncbi:TORTIFOLIA1-like protein 3 [Zingiber officinale]|nr:TORTIFOLIA1-like protein 3 [Zingiber officinale]XP_042453748.1 TORTIFOLIA1-like protein 3 [Zingiber officinale]
MPGMASRVQQQPAGSNEEGVRQRVNRCMMKLSDRDTEAMAASELDAIARGLTDDAFPPFLSAIADARPTDKTPLRRHSLRLLSLLSHSHPASAVAPHLPRMLAAALRRLRDPDSSVRGACVEALRSMAAAHPPALASVLLRPLSEALLHEQDQCAQTSAALSLAAAVDAATASDLDPDLAHHLQRLLPRLVKLLRSNAFKAKAALLSLLGSVAGAGGAATAQLVALLIPCLVESLASEDWATRKAAAESLSLLALKEKELLSGFRSSCISSFESRRFDKVKIVRDSMNRMLDVWKDIPEVPESEIKPQSQQANSSTRETMGGVRFPSPAAASSIQSAKNVSSSRSPPPAASPIPTSRTNVPSIRNKKLSPPLFRKAEQRPSNWRVEIPVSVSPGEVVDHKQLPKYRKQEPKGNVRSRLEARRVLFEGNSEDKGNKLASHVVPFQETAQLEQAIGSYIKEDDLNAGHKVGNLSTIRMQLVQIENQQSNLLELLQKFIGNSQNVLHSLETRVHGLELTLDEISRNFTLSSLRMANDDPTSNTCCRLPGTEFLSTKFWRKIESRNSTRLSVSELQNSNGRETRNSYQLDKWRVGVQGGLVVNPLAEINSQSVGSSESIQVKMLNSVAHEKEITYAHPIK